MQINKKKIKYFVFDLDGTLLTSKKNITERTLKAIHELSKNGNKIIVATGRAHYLNTHISKLIKLDYPIISSNGGLIFDYKKEKVVKKIIMNKDLAKKVFEILTEYKIDFLIYTADVLVVNVYNENNPWYMRYKSIKPQNDPTYNSKPGISGEEFYKNIDKYEVAKFLVLTHGMKPEKIEQIHKLITAINKNIYIVSSEGGMFDVMVHGATKGTGLEFIANEYDINLDETIVFGDADNDVSMFEIAKYSVAMGNAVDQLKKIASHTTETNDNDGVAKFIETHFL